MGQYKQAVTRAPEQPLAALLGMARRPSLVAWYGNPVDRPAAEALCARAQRELRVRQCSGASGFPLYLLQLICHYWMGATPAMEYLRPGLPVDDQRDAALLQLCYGQLLVSCKLRPAMRHLARGFALAVPYLEPAEYLALLRRHERLAALHLTDTPSPAGPLPGLLAEAGVIRCLQRAGPRRIPVVQHVDTLG